MPLIAQRDSVTVIPWHLTPQQVAVDKRAILVSYPPAWTPEQVAAVVRAAVGERGGSPSPTPN